MAWERPARGDGGGGGGPPGTWRQVAAGSIVLISNAETLLATVTLAAGERVAQFAPTPTNSTTGRKVVSNRTTTQPANNVCHWMLTSTPSVPGQVRVQARQYNTLNTALGYDYVVYAVTPA